MKNKFLKRITVSAALLLSFVLLIGTKAEVRNLPDDKTPTSKIIEAQKLIEDIKYLSSDELRGREAGTEENKVARNYVLKRFKESGIEPFKCNYLENFSFKTGETETVTGINVVGFIKGKKYPEKYIVITAHYDHLGVRRGQIFNGADDNASGTAALFAIAKYFKKKQPEHTLIFAALDAEEKGLRGARHFVDNPPVKLENILLNINMDMISRNDKGELYAAGTYHYPQLKKHLDHLLKKAPVKLKLGHDDPKLGRDDWTFQSDHGAFHRKKIPFIYFGVEDHPDYHRPTDDFENIQPEFYVRAVETIVSAIKSFDKDF